MVRKEHKELSDFLWCNFALKLSYLNLILVKVWTLYLLYNRSIIYQYTLEEAEVTNMSMTRGYWFEMDVIRTEEEKQKNEMQVGKYNNTWTTGICPCNTANVRAVQWRVSGWTDGYLWAVLTTYKQIKVIFFKELHVIKFNLPESQACEGVSEIENLRKVLYKMIGLIFFLQKFSQYWNCSCWFDSLNRAHTKWSLFTNYCSSI